MQAAQQVEELGEDIERGIEGLRRRIGL